MSALFERKRGIVVSCDVQGLDALERLVRSVSHLDFVVGYKVGVLLGVAHGLPRVVETIRDRSELPIIYDHQKMGGDIPEMVGEQVRLVAKAGVNGVIIFPHGGSESLKAALEGCKDAGVKALVGGEMTHRSYVASEGGYIADGAPERIYSDAAATGLVDHFIVPGTKVGEIQRIAAVVAERVSAPVFLFPGIGKGQGGDIAEAFRAVSVFSSFAIVGRGIYAETDPAAAAERLWSAASSVAG